MAVSFVYNPDLFGIVLLVLGIIGEYLGKILLTLNHTPQYIVRETINIRPKTGDVPGKEADGKERL